MEYLTDIQKEKIIAFNNDEVLVDAIKKVMLAVIYENGTLRKDVKVEPMRNAAFGFVSLSQMGLVMSNEQIGEDLRAVFQGASLLEQGFMKLQTIKAEDGSVESPYVNPGI